MTELENPTYTFTPKISWGEPDEARWSQEEIANETMLFGADTDFALRHGGPITQHVLSLIDLDVLHLAPEPGYVVIDSRVHMLMPGQYPAIPGWHCDGIERANYVAQPDMTKLDNGRIHFTYHTSAGPHGFERPVSSTCFLTYPCTLEVNPERVWASVSEELSRLPVLGVGNSQDGQLMRFNSMTLHRASPAEARGWRYWFRASQYHTPPKNQIRKQVQVYTTLHGGW